MHQKILSAALAAFNAMAVTAAMAQAPATAPRPDPADAKAAVPATLYASPFAAYRPLGDVSTGKWKDTNDTVGKIGGWKVYSREGQQAGEPAKPAEAGHAGHKMK